MLPLKGTQELIITVVADTNMSDKYKCSCCHTKIAVWCYIPSSDRMKEEDRYYCDDCISSPEDNGCSCNWHYTNINAYHPPLDEPEIPEGEEGKDWRWVDKSDGSWQYLDDKGRPYPCCEYWHDEEGWEID